MADSGDYSEIWVIKGLRNVSPGISPNWRPDVFGKRKSDGKIDGYEVPSKSQTDNEILDKLEDIKKELGDLAGKCKLKNIPSKHSGKPIPKDL
ncbi:hypothetical protein [Bremerella cremea]|uniref:hypothetical protein n=1 Tax=Bremerella cremea TaxID=1031537 RepID=UPI0031E6433F